MCFLPKVVNVSGFANNINDTAGILSWSERQVESKYFNVGGVKIPEFHQFKGLEFLLLSEFDLNIISTYLY